jgi:hypothetical protein
MREAGVDAAIIHPPTSWDPSANALAIEAAYLHPDRFAIPATSRSRGRRPRADRRLDEATGRLGLRFTFLSRIGGVADGRTIDWLAPPTRRLPVAPRCKLPVKVGRRGHPGLA